MKLETKAGSHRPFPDGPALKTGVIAHESRVDGGPFCQPQGFLRFLAEAVGDRSEHFIRIAVPVARTEGGDLTVNFWENQKL